MGTKKTSKKSKKGAQKKTGATAKQATTKLKLSSRRSANILLSPADAPSQFTGSLHFESVASFLVSSGSSLLVMHRPQGNYTPADIGAAASFLRHVLGKDEGDPTAILGFSANLFGQQSILMVSAN